MTTGLIKFAAGIVGPAWAKPALIALGILLLGGLGGIAKCTYDSGVIARHEAKVERKIDKKLVPANQHAESDRANDAVIISKNERERHDAIHSVPDAAPAAPSQRLACDRLRRAGRDTSKIPACAGPQGGNGAQAHPGR